MGKSNGKCMSLRRGISLALAASIGVATPASAHSIDQSSMSLELTIRGKVSPKCEISLSSRSVDVILDDNAGAHALPFMVDCNQRMNVEMRSLNGGLQHTKLGRDARFPGFANFVPYRASFALDTEGARVFSVKSTEIIAPAQGSIGLVPYQASGSLNLAWDQTLPLLGGQYRDVIEIRVSGD